MATLVLLRSGLPQVRFVLGDSSTLGRSSACEIQLLDPRLSRQHARILRRGEAWWLEDLGSRNGTCLNGEPVQGEARLRSGDAVSLGDTEALFDPPLELLHARDGEGSVCLVEASPGAVTGLEGAARDGLGGAALAEVHRITCALLGELELERLLPALLDRLLAHFGADRGYVLLLEGPEGRLRPAALRAPRDVLAISRTLVDRVLAERRPLLVRNALEDLSFEGSRSVIAHGLRSVMAVPLEHGGEVLGVLQLDHREPDAFDQPRLAQLALLGESASLAVVNARAVAAVRHRAAPPPGGERPFVGRSAAVTRLLEAARKAARADARVLITGESGTGKELIARLLHDAGPRSRGPFVALHCAAVPETLLESALFGHERGAFTGATARHRGCFEQADGGTLFLDEIGEVGPATQVRLLRVLQEGTFRRLGSEHLLEVDVRVVAATNQPLEARVAEGRFREDLFYRLNVVRLQVPPLRERPDDVPELLDHFLARHARALGRPLPALDPAARSLLEGYRWPGNVRELENLTERLLVLLEGDTVRAADLPPEITGAFGGRAARATTLREVLDETERELVRRALRETGGRKAAACRLLGISRPTLDKKIRDYGLDV